MALTTYAELQASIASWIDHDALTATIPDFIALAEAQFPRDIRHRKMVTSADLTIDTRFTDLPADHLDTIRLDCNGRRLTVRSSDDMIERRDNNTAAGQPCYWTQIGEQIEVWPTPDASYTGTLQYYAKVTPLSDGATSNWILTTAPDIYLYGALLHSAPFLAEDARLGTWAELYAAAVRNLNKTDKSGQWPSAMSIPARNS